MSGPIAFQGRPGAYSDLACRKAFPGVATLPCETFEGAMEALRDGRADLAMLPCENSLAGRVPDIHSLLPERWPFGGRRAFPAGRALPAGAAGGVDRRIAAGAFPCGGVGPGAGHFEVAQSDRGDRGRYRRCGADGGGVERPGRGGDRLVAGGRDLRLDVLRANVEDAAHNTTRFYVMAREALRPSPDMPGLMTTFIFRVRNVPAALYKALGGFATNGVNMTKLESYMVGGEFTATQFLCDVDGHPDHPGLKRALEELAFFSAELRILGVYASARP